MRFPTANARQVRETVWATMRETPNTGWQLGAAFALLTLGSLADVSVPLLLGRIVDAVVSDTGANLVVLGVALAAAAIAGAALSAGGFYLASRVTERAIARLREDMVSTALELPAHRVEEPGAGDVVSRATDDVAALSAAVSTAAPAVANSTFSFAATALALVGMDWRFLAVIACAGPIYLWGARNYLRVAPRRYAREREAMADRAQQVLEATQGRETIRALGWEPRIGARIHDASWSVVVSGFAARRTMMTLQVWVTVVQFVMLVVGLIVGFVAVGHSALTLGAATSAILMLIRVRGPMMGLMRVLDTLQSGYASLARIIGIMIDPPAAKPHVEPPVPHGEVVMDHVGFSYGDTWAIRDLNVRVSAGEKVAIVGPSGAGKTTVATLAAGMRTPDSGKVTVDGASVSALADADRRHLLALISQEVHVFSGTVRDNLRLGDEDASDENMREALRAVGWEGDPDLDARVGEELDPIAAQQLALARILLLDPAVVIMDEATAEAGTAGASALDEAAARVASGRSALIVAHRLDQARVADRIYVMRDGKVVEEGTHEELVDYGGQYASLWTAWKKGR